MQDSGAQADKFIDRLLESLQAWSPFDARLPGARPLTCKTPSNAVTKNKLHVVSQLLNFWTAEY
jgi:hypothetical protein